MCFTVIIILDFLRNFMVGLWSWKLNVEAPPREPHDELQGWNKIWADLGPKWWHNKQLPYFNKFENVSDSPFLTFVLIWIVSWKLKMIESLELAAINAAIEDGVLVDYNSKERSTTTTTTNLRRGKWTPEEEAYANRLIFEFKLGNFGYFSSLYRCHILILYAGHLPLTDGTTLRTFLSKLLNCDPMRISKKFTGSNCIGKVLKCYAMYLNDIISHNNFIFQANISA